LYGFLIDQSVRKKVEKSLQVLMMKTKEAKKVPHMAARKH